MPKVARALAVVSTLLAACSARGADFSVRLFSEVTLRGVTEVSSEASSRASSEGSSATSREDAQYVQADGRRGVDGAPCRQHNDCQGWCQDARCVSGQPGMPPPPVAATRPPPEPQCREDLNCRAGMVCWYGQCVVPGPAAAPAPPQPTQPHPVQPVQPVQPVPLPPAPAGAACTTHQHCGPGQACLGGQCTAAPPPPPAILRRGTELYLRERVVQLRQDLAFGEGPTITALASLHGVSVAALGRSLRAHRAELAALVGDGADVGWADRFLRRVEELERACPGA